MYWEKRKQHPLPLEGLQLPSSNSHEDGNKNSMLLLSSAPNEKSQPWRGTAE
jgi:hypothetical protein